MGGQGVVERGFERVGEAFRRNFVDGRETGAGLCVYWRGRPVVDLWDGYSDDQQRVPWRRDSMAGLASATKGLAAGAALHLVERGQLDLDARVTDYWPEFGAEGKSEITVRTLLSHRAGVVALDAHPVTYEDLRDGTPIIEALAAARPEWEPGTAHGYHAMTIGHLISEVVRRITGLTVGRYFAAEIAGPLGLECYIGVPDDRLARVATMIVPDTLGLDTPPQDATKSDISGLGTAPQPSTTGSDNPASDIGGRGSGGADRDGSDSSALDRGGSDRSGSDSSALDRGGSDTGGSDSGAMGGGGAGGVGQEFAAPGGAVGEVGGSHVELALGKHVPAMAGLYRALNDPGSLTYRATVGSVGMDWDSANDPRYYQVESPSADGVASAASLAKYYAALIGEVDGIRLLSREVVDAARTVYAEGMDRVLMIPTAWGLGFSLPDGPLFPVPSQGAFGHGGATGSLAFADPDWEVSFAYVPNRASEVLEGTDLRGIALVEALYASLR